MVQILVFMLPRYPKKESIRNDGIALLVRLQVSRPTGPHPLSISALPRNRARILTNATLDKRRRSQSRGLSNMFLQVLKATDDRGSGSTVPVFTGEYRVGMKYQ